MRARVYATRAAQRESRAAQLLALQLSPAPMAPARGGEGGSSQQAMVGSRRVASGAAVRNTPERARRSTCNGEGARLSLSVAGSAAAAAAPLPPRPHRSWLATTRETAAGSRSLQFGVSPERVTQLNDEFVPLPLPQKGATPRAWQRPLSPQRACACAHRSYPLPQHTARARRRWWASPAGQSPRLRADQRPRR